MIWAHVCSLSWTQLDPWHVVNMNELNAVAVMEHGRREGGRLTCTANGTKRMLRLLNAWSRWPRLACMDGDCMGMFVQTTHAVPPNTPQKIARNLID